ncbi:hypothetical protein HDU93_009800 [Gonapodya sp. JEL0774]|nr:hypothetical protein HDU93_009800 [Gonapodya sp. JEL0774]
MFWYTESKLSASNTALVDLDVLFELLESLRPAYGDSFSNAVMSTTLQILSLASSTPIARPQVYHPLGATVLDPECAKSTLAASKGEPTDGIPSAEISEALSVPLSIPSTPLSPVQPDLIHAAASLKSLLRVGTETGEVKSVDCFEKRAGSESFALEYSRSTVLDHVLSTHGIIDIVVLTCAELEASFFSAHNNESVVGSLVETEHEHSELSYAQSGLEFPETPQEPLSPNKSSVDRPECCKAQDYIDIIVEIPSTLCPNSDLSAVDHEIRHVGDLRSDASLELYLESDNFRPLSELSEPPSLELGQGSLRTRKSRSQLRSFGPLARWGEEELGEEEVEGGDEMLESVQPQPLLKPVVEKAVVLRWVPEFHGGVENFFRYRMCQDSVRMWRGTAYQIDPQPPKPPSKNSSTMNGARNERRNKANSSERGKPGAIALDAGFGSRPLPTSLPPIPRRETGIDGSRPLRRGSGSLSAGSSLSLALAGVGPPSDNESRNSTVRPDSGSVASLASGENLDESNGNVPIARMMVVPLEQYARWSTSIAAGPRVSPPKPFRAPRHDGHPLTPAQSLLGWKVPPQAVGDVSGLKENPDRTQEELVSQAHKMSPPPRTTAVAPSVTSDPRTVTVSNYQLMRDSPAWMSFEGKVQAETRVWKNVEYVVHAVECMARDWSLPWLDLSIPYLHRLASDPLFNHPPAGLTPERPFFRPLNRHVLLALLSNKFDVESLARTPGQRYKAPDGAIAAAIKLQSQAYHLKLHRARQLTYQLLKNWGKMYSGKRVVVHIPPCPTPSAPFHLGRLLDLRDAGAQVVIIVPDDIGHEERKEAERVAALSRRNPSVSEWILQPRDGGASATLYVPALGGCAGAEMAIRDASLPEGESWDDFEKRFLARGGGTVAVARIAEKDLRRVRAFVEVGVRGMWRWGGSCEVIVDGTQVLGGGFFPQHVVRHSDLLDATMHVVEACWENDILGMVSIEFMPLVLWASDINLGTHDSLLDMHYLLLVLGARVDDTGAHGDAYFDENYLRRLRMRYANTSTYIDTAYAVVRKWAFLTACAGAGVTWDEKLRIGVWSERFGYEVTGVEAKRVVDSDGNCEATPQGDEEEDPARTEIEFVCAGKSPCDAIKVCLNALVVMNRQLLNVEANSDGSNFMHRVNILRSYYKSFQVYSNPRRALSMRDQVPCSGLAFSQSSYPNEGLGSIRSEIPASLTLSAVKALLLVGVNSTDGVAYSPKWADPTRNIVAPPRSPPPRLRRRPFSSHHSRIVSNLISKKASRPATAPINLCANLMSGQRLPITSNPRQEGRHKRTKGTYDYPRIVSTPGHLVTRQPVTSRKLPKFVPIAPAALEKLVSTLVGIDSKVASFIARQKMELLEQARKDLPPVESVLPTFRMSEETVELLNTPIPSVQLQRDVERDQEKRQAQRLSWKASLEERRQALRSTHKPDSAASTVAAANMWEEYDGDIPHEYVDSAFGTRPATVGTPVEAARQIPTLVAAHLSTPEEREQPRIAVSELELPTLLGTHAGNGWKSDLPPTLTVASSTLEATIGQNATDVRPVSRRRSTQLGGAVKSIMKSVFTGLKDI